MSENEGKFSGVNSWHGHDGQDGVVVLTVSRVCGPPRGLSWSGGGPEHRGARVVSGEPAPSLSRRTQHLHQIDTLDTLDM